MAKVNLTTNRIDEFSCPPDKWQAFLWATALAGFGVRATGNKKTFILQTRLNGKTIRLTIGPTSHWSIPDAEAEARRLQVLIDKNQDPREVRAEETAARVERQAEAALAEERRTVTGLDAWQAYCKDRKGRWGDRSYSDHVVIAQPGGEPHKRGSGTTQPGPLFKLLNQPLADIDAEKVSKWVDRETKLHPARTRLAFRLLRGFLNWCARSEQYKDIVKSGATSKKETREALGKPTLRETVLQKEQLKAWFENVRKIGNPVISAYLQTLLLTGARPGEVITLKWADINFQWGSLVIRDKVEGERTIPLTPMVSQLLSSLQHRNKWVFSSPASADGRLTEPRIAHNQALTTAALPDMPLYGLRASFATLSEWVECPAGVVAQIMGHKPSAIAEKHYIKRSLDLLRKWHEKIECWMLEQAGIAAPVAKTGLRVVASN